MIIRSSHHPIPSFPPSLRQANWTTGFPGGSGVENPPANARHAGSIPGSGRSPGKGNCNRLQYSCLGIPMDREAWQATAHRIAESDRIWQLSTHKLDYTISKSFSGSEPHCVSFKVEAMRNQEAPSRRAGSSYSCLASAPAACGE